MQHKRNMAAPCVGIVGRPLLHVLPRFGRTTARICHFSYVSAYRSPLKTKGVIESKSSPWNLMAAVCLQRLPVISAEHSPIEQQFKQMMEQVEQEKSLLSDHEIRLLEDAERVIRRQADDYDSDDEESGDQEIVFGHDLEDSWEQNLKNFHPAQRTKADEDKNMSSVQRCLADSLVLLAQQEVGSEKLWLLPQAQWQKGETLRQTAERALASLSGLDATFLSNAPCGVYKYKLPKAARTDTSIGTKVFFFKAILSHSDAFAAQHCPVMWLKKSELQGFLKPAYMLTVDRFILDL
ncbi:large ribosomal subunit protein mL46 isoform X2 [Cynoglossus semilaevis]|uniref:large ribosomal subunit protein mL46 isoform X2 n=1 Tax=Cynoglossus semilaevis TaxID=244447 RepID=UPI00049731DB|nr:39S ribosomal protein L46, mitochondrial isoform X2 [Cynoglossus semilaevis]